MTWTMPRHKPEGDKPNRMRGYHITQEGRKVRKQRSLPARIASPETKGHLPAAPEGRRRPGARATV